MARKHSKTGVIKRNVTTETVTALTSERHIVQNPVTGEIEVKIISRPAVVKQGKALGSTRSRGEKNVVPSKPNRGGAK